MWFRTILLALAKDRNEALAFGRRLDHSGLSHAEMLVTAGRHTAARTQGRHVLAIQDASERNLPEHGGVVALRRPATVDRRLAGRVDLFVVDVGEIDPPAGVEALPWRLLTTHAVPYGSTGRTWAAAMGPAAAPAVNAIDRRVGGKAAALNKPHPPHSLAWLAWRVARLGAWSGDTSGGYQTPAPETIARGLRRFGGLIDGCNVAAAHNGNRYRSVDVRVPSPIWRGCRGRGLPRTVDDWAGWHEAGRRGTAAPAVAVCSGCGIIALAQLRGRRLCRGSSRRNTSPA